MTMASEPDGYNSIIQDGEKIAVLTVTLHAHVSLQ